MGVEIRYADPDDLEQWNELVEESPQTTPFHHGDALEVLARHSNATLHPLVGYKGDCPVGLFPLFEIKKGPVATVFSPPPRLKIPYLGPVQLNHENLKQRKAESDREAFTDGCIDYLEENVAPRYVHVRTSDRYPDIRSFSWNDFDVTPRYTYVVDLTRDKKELLETFSADARKNVTSDYPAEFEIEEGGRAAIEPIISQVIARHAAQGEPYHLTPEFVEDLWEATPEGMVRPYVCTVDGEFEGGMVALEAGDTTYRWQGGAKVESEIPVNDLVDWHIMVDGMERGLSRYDLVGANTPRLNGYKAKFAPQLGHHYEMNKSSRTMRWMAAVYSRVLEVAPVTTQPK